MNDAITEGKGKVMKEEEGGRKKSEKTEGGE